MAVPAPVLLALALLVLWTLRPVMLHAQEATAGKSAQSAGASSKAGKSAKPVTPAKAAATPAKSSKAASNAALSKAAGDAIVDGLRRLVADHRTRAVDEQIHAVWYLVRWSDRRFERAQEQFARDTKETRYEPFLPASAKPPLSLNQATMDKYRAEMKKHYLNRRPEFQ
jgi:hypothetical protein